MEGKLLGNRYEMIQELGRGGMALVYLANDRVLKRKVAVKILRPDLAGDPEFLKRFHTEAQAAAGLSHPNIVGVYDFGSQGDTHYIVMEYVEGEPLKRYIERQGMLPWQQAVDFAIQVCKALDCAHKHGVVHRDIKPHNIILTPDMRLKVTDFGIARAATAATVTMNNSTMGSVHYFSPEQARGGYTDAKSDLYSLGVVLYEMVTGHVPFDGDSPVAIAVMHLQKQPVSPKDYNVALPLSVEQIILKAMSKEQSQRYQSAADMLADLQKARTNTSFVPQPTPLSSVSGAGGTAKMPPTAPPPKRTAPQTPPRRQEQKGKKTSKADKNAVILAIVTSVVLVSLLIVGVVAVVNPGAFGGGGDEIEIPNLVGEDFEKVAKQYEKQDIVIRKVREVASSEYQEGEIVDQDPKAGKKVKVKSLKEISVVVSTGAEEITLKNYANKTFTDVKSELEQYDLKVVEEKENSDSIPEGVVIRTSPRAGSKVQSGDEITVYVSSGPEKTERAMPNLLGESLSNAKSILAQYNLRLGEVTEANSSKAKNTVIGQSVSVGASVEDYQTIDLTVSNGSGGESSGTDSEHTGGNTGGGSANENGGSGPADDKKEKSIGISVPQDREQTLVKVTVDGTTIHEGTHSKAEQAFNLTVRGTGAVKVEIYYDGVLSSSNTVEL